MTTSAPAAARRTVHGGPTSRAAGVCAAILGQVGACLAGQEHSIEVREVDGGGARAARARRDRAAAGADGSVTVWIRSADVEGCREDVAAALVGAHAALAGLAGVLLAQRRGSGVLAEVDAVDVIATCQGDRLARLVCPKPAVGEGHPGAVHRPPAVLPCLDGYVGVHAPTAEDQRLLQTLTDGEDLAAWVARRRRAEVVEAGQVWRLPVVPVLEPGEVDARQPLRFAWTGWPSRGAPSGALPLGGLTVLDLGMVWAGPYCGRLLAGLGARVIKVEGPQRPDGTRQADRQACQGAFADLNRGKASLVVDLSRAEGREVLLRLVRSTDVLIENFSPRVMPNFGLDYADLARVNPGLVMLSMPAFADAGGVAYGSGLELAAGLVGWGADGRPQPSQVAYLDYLAGCYGAIGVVAALVRGQAAHVSLAQRDVAARVVALGGWRRRRQPGLVLDDPRGLVQRAQRSGLLAREARACRHYARLPFRLAGLRRRREADAPALGAHTRRVLRRDAGLSRADVEALLATGVAR